MRNNIFSKILLVIIVALFFLYPKYILASDISCDNRFLTLVNPVRGRDMWGDKTIKPLVDQYEIVKRYNFPATWLLQYDALTDIEIKSFFNSIDKNQELGLFLEISPKLTENSRVIYPHAVPWSSPSAIFLSGYSQSDRKKIIDTLFFTFKDNFGYYPKSVGAWWIDSYSLTYMKEKYNISTVMIVADQQTTDHYGVWGQWWGFPYRPTKANVLIPASSKSNKEDVVVIQWAQRDPDIAYGEGPVYSNYSLQANDYIRQGLNTNYFKSLTSKYLDCTNTLGQITIGLETGLEASEYKEEYDNQLKYLSSINNLNTVTMNEFYIKYNNLFEINPEKVIFSGDKTTWELTQNKRINNSLEDEITYNQNYAFSDYFIKDSSEFLDRRLNTLKASNLSYSNFLLYIILWGIVSIYFIYKKKSFNWIMSTIFLISCFGLVLKSEFLYGWFVYYGPVISNLIYIKAFLVLIVFLIFYFFKSKLFILLLPLTFAFDFIIKVLRYSYFSGSYYFGIMWDSLKFVGIKFTRPFSFKLVNSDFPSVTASSFLKFNFDKIWQSNILSFIIYPLIHFLLAFLMYKVLKKIPLKFQKIIIILLVILFILYLYLIIMGNPRVVVQIK